MAAVPLPARGRERTPTEGDMRAKCRLPCRRRFGTDPAYAGRYVASQVPRRKPATPLGTMERREPWSLWRESTPPYGITEVRVSSDPFAEQRRALAEFRKALEESDLGKFIRWLCDRLEALPRRRSAQ